MRRVTVTARALSVMTVCLLLSGGMSVSLLAQSPAPEPGAEEPGGEFPVVQVELLEKGDSSRNQLKSALDALPLQHLSADHRKRVNEILENRALFRRLPTIGVECAPEIYSHFTANPESAVAIWRAMGISKFTLTPQNGNVWVGDAGDGSRGTIELLLKTPETHLLLCDGEYRSPVLPNIIRAKALMHLRTRPMVRENGEQRVVHDLDLFVMFPQQTVETVAKVVSPVSHMIADRNFRELSMFVRFMHVVMERQPGWVERVVQKMDGVSFEQKEELLQLSARVYVAARKAEARQTEIAPAGLRTRGVSLEVPR